MAVKWYLFLNSVRASVAKCVAVRRGEFDWGTVL